MSPKNISHIVAAAEVQLGDLSSVNTQVSSKNIK